MITATKPTTTSRHASIVPLRGDAAADFWGPLVVMFVAAVWISSFAIEMRLAALILTAAAYAMAIAGLRWPVIGLFGIGILCTTDTIGQRLLLHGGLLRWNTFNYWLLAVAALALPLLLKLRSIQTVLLGLLLLVLFVQLSYSTDVKRGAANILNIASVSGVLIYFARACQSGRTWYWLGAVCGTVGALGGLAFITQQHFMVLSDANIWAYLPLTAIFAINLACVAGCPSRSEQLFLVLLAATNTAWLFLCGSRGGMVIACCSLSLIILQAPRIWDRFFYVALLAATACAILAFFPELRDRTFDRVDTIVNPDMSARRRTSGRSDLALGAWYIFLEHPMGVGTGGFPEAWSELGPQQGLSGFGSGEKIAAHSGWMQTLAENGIPGFVLLGAFIVSFAVAGWNGADRSACYLGGLVTLTLVVALVPHDLACKGLWFLVAGALIVLHPFRTTSAAARARVTRPLPAGIEGHA